MSISSRNVAVLLMLATAAAPTAVHAKPPMVQGFAPPIDARTMREVPITVPVDLRADVTPRVEAASTRDLGTLDLAALLAGFTVLTAAPDGTVSKTLPSPELEALLWHRPAK